MSADRIETGGFQFPYRSRKPYVGMVSVVLDNVVEANGDGRDVGVRGVDYSGIAPCGEDTEGSDLFSRGADGDDAEGYHVHAAQVTIDTELQQGRALWFRHSGL